MTFVLIYHYYGGNSTVIVISPQFLLPEFLTQLNPLALSYRPPIGGRSPVCIFILTIWVLRNSLSEFSTTSIFLLNIWDILSQYFSDSSISLSSIFVIPIPFLLSMLVRLAGFPVFIIAALVKSRLNLYCFL